MFEHKDYWEDREGSKRMKEAQIQQRKVRDKMSETWHKITSCRQIQFKLLEASNSKSGRFI